MASASEPDANVEVEENETNGEMGEATPLIVNKPEGQRWWWSEVTPYSVYVLFTLLLAYLFNQLDRYLLAINAKSMAQSIHFGDMGCLRNESVQDFGENLDCNGTNADSCSSILNSNGSVSCEWDFNGQGWDYQILAGPVFILIYTFAGIFVGFAADLFNRKILLAVCLIFWSVMTLLTGLVQEYWQLVVVRFGLGLGEAGCTPFAASLIADYFTQSTRGTALGIYNFGIYFGYGLSYAVGNFITEADIDGKGWRWSFILPAIPGILVGLIIAWTVKEPSRVAKEPTDKQVQDSNQPINGKKSVNHRVACSHLKKLLGVFMAPSLILLCVAGSIRNAGGYVWAYNTQPYFDAAGVPKSTTGMYMSWIPLVGGSVGVLVGGFISDRIIKRKGLYARTLVLVASQLLAAPFAAGALFLSSPYAFLSLIPANIIGEMWVGVTLAVAMEFVPKEMRTTAVAVYLFIITNIGGNVPLLVPLLQNYFEGQGANKAYGLRDALYILYPGLYLVSGLLFLVTMLVMKRDLNRLQYRAEEMAAASKESSQESQETQDAQEVPDTQEIVEA